MCYPCTFCGRCGKFDPSSPLYTPPPVIPCMECGGEVDLVTGMCGKCGAIAFAPTGERLTSGTEKCRAARLS